MGPLVVRPVVGASRKLMWTSRLFRVLSCAPGGIAGRTVTRIDRSLLREVNRGYPFRLAAPADFLLPTELCRMQSCRHEDDPRASPGAVGTLP